MWFAALGTYHHNPWFLNLVYRLLMNEREGLFVTTLTRLLSKERSKSIQENTTHANYT